MKLRTKFQDEDFELGEVVTADIATMPDGRIKLQAVAKKGGLHTIFYDKLEKLYDEWKDYEEPKVKDEKIRKAVRAWAEANDLLTFKVVNEHFDCCKVIGYGDHNISSRIEFKSTIAHVNKNQFYTINELCGQEEE